MLYYNGVFLIGIPAGGIQKLFRELKGNAHCLLYGIIEGSPRCFNGVSKTVKSAAYRNDTYANVIAIMV